MRVLLSILLTLSLVSLLLPGASAETYRYVASGLPVGCQDDPFGEYDGICPGPIEFPLSGHGFVVFDLEDDAMGASVAYSVLFLDADGGVLDAQNACGTLMTEIPMDTATVRVTFRPLLVDEDLTVCGATTGVFTTP